MNSTSNVAEAELQRKNVEKMVLACVPQAGISEIHDILAWLDVYGMRLVKQSDGMAQGAAHTCSYSCDRPECIKAQRDELAAAAAQEAVPFGWTWIASGQAHFTRDSRRAQFLIEAGDYPVTALYAAPVTAAPADARSLALAVEQALGWRDVERDAELDSLLETAMGILDGTTAAPGMGNTTPVDRGALQMAINVLRRAGKDEVAEALIDASPKGALNEQFGSAEVLDIHASMEAHYRQALERIASQGTHHGPDGTRESWRHWCEIARDALADSPKGGSEVVSDAMVEVAAKAMFYANTPENMIKSDWDSGAILGPNNEHRNNLIRMAKAALGAVMKVGSTKKSQAGDAEVQP